VDEGADMAALLIKTAFSLAYDVLLLSHTCLHLVRSRRYGVLGPYSVGKSMLTSQLGGGNVENFPPQDRFRES
jgi:ATPase subunit of ABC transporter with duplicated ATPase domains